MAGNAQQSPLMDQPPASFADLKPLMICGTMRSGTTLLWTLLDAHPQLAVIPGDIGIYERAFERRVPRFWFHTAEYMLSERWIKSFANTWRRRIRTSRARMRQRMLEWSEDFGPETSEARVDLVDEALSGVRGPEDYWRAFYDMYANHFMPPSGNCSYWVVQPPGMERFAQFTEVQFEGQANYIHMVRDPRDVVASSITAAEITDEQRSQSILRFCHHWARSVHAGSVNARQCETRYRMLRYEDLVAGHSRVMRRVAASLGIPMDNTLLVPTSNSIPARANSAYTSNFPAGFITRRQVGMFRRILTEQEIALIEGLLGDQMKACRYEEESSSPGKGTPGGFRGRQIRRIQARTSPITFVA